MSVVPPLPMLVLSLLVEGPARILTSLTSWSAPGAAGAVVGLVYTVLVGTVLGSGLWTWLMTRHPAGVVAPFSMLVPVVGMTAAWLVLGEDVTPVELVGGAVVVVGVLLGSLPRRVLPGGPTRDGANLPRRPASAGSRIEPDGDAAPDGGARAPSTV
jgi:O-acetylserine/cysteine efflux transporter